MTKVINLYSIECDTLLESHDPRDLESYNDNNINNNVDNNNLLSSLLKIVNNVFIGNKIK